MQDELSSCKSRAASHVCFLFTLATCRGPLSNQNEAGMYGSFSGCQCDFLFLDSVTDHIVNFLIFCYVSLVAPN